MEEFGLPAGSSRVTITTSPITVFWRPGCPYCMRLRRSLRRAGVAVQEVNIWDDPGGAAVVRSLAGGTETVPTVVIGDRAMINPSPRRVIEEISTRLPDLLPRQEKGRGAARRTHPRLEQVAQWVVIAMVIAASLVVDALGHATLSWALDAVAIATALVLTVIRRNGMGSRRVPSP